MPTLYEFAPGRYINIHLLVSIEFNNVDNLYQYFFLGPQLINLTPEQHSRFLEFYKDHQNFFNRLESEY